MLTQFGTLIATCHIYHTLTFCFLYKCFTCNTLRAIAQLHIACNRTTAQTGNRTPVNVSRGTIQGTGCFTWNKETGY